MLGAVPSDLFPHIDTQRFCELVVDGDTTPIPDPADLDANTNAVKIVNAAQTKIVQACRKSQIYSIQQLKDLVYASQQDNPQGDQIMLLISDITWCRLTTRKRLAPNSPQQKEPACKEAEDLLDRLQKGERLWVLEGIPQRNEAGEVIGTYGDAGPQAGLMEGGTLTAACEDPPNLFGCKWNNCGPYSTGSGGCCG